MADGLSPAIYTGRKNQMADFGDAICRSGTCTGDSLIAHASAGSPGKSDTQESASVGFRRTTIHRLAVRTIGYA
jgi:hypothetical protein